MPGSFSINLLPSQLPSLSFARYAIMNPLHSSSRSNLRSPDQHLILSPPFLERCTFSRFSFIVISPLLHFSISSHRVSPMQLQTIPRSIAFHTLAFPFALSQEPIRIPFL
ncbi:hypothetical protein BDY24DRAFT_381717, partial [Mrakia frigida]|uniref:uncharacterized protein n=1 Tax=Mrakia frigida TaxID=29902 RepID=UPI003FCC222C